MSGNMRECRIEGCTHLVAPMNEVDVDVTICVSTEVPICEDCYNSHDLKIKKQIKQLEQLIKKLPF